MGKLKRFQIHFDSPNGVYYPGQTVTGQVVLELKDEMKVKEIKVTASGTANVHWSEQRRTQQGTHTIHYSSQEQYFSFKIVVLGKETGQKGDVVLRPGNYNYPVSFTLPQGLPCSYEADIGRVRYMVKASIDRPWAFDEHTKAPFTVVSIFDLNAQPGLMNCAKAEDEKVMCCLCCKSDPIKATITIHRQGHVPGEAVLFDAEINNESKRDLKSSRIRFMMQVTYYAKGGTKTINNCLQELKHGKVSGKSRDVWTNEKLLIPPVPPSGLLGCSIIDIKYFATLIAEPSGLGFSLSVPVEVVIGNVPFASVAQQYGMNIQADAPLPSYAESAFGRVNTLDAEDQNTTGNNDYAPMYGYYNWQRGNNNPASNFRV